MNSIRNTVYGNPAKSAVIGNEGNPERTAVLINMCRAKGCTRISIPKGPNEGSTIDTHIRKRNRLRGATTYRHSLKKTCNRIAVVIYGRAGSIRLKTP